MKLQQKVYRKYLIQPLYTNNVSSILETKALKSDSFLTNSFVDAFNSQGLSRFIFTKNGIIDHVIKKRKENEIKTDKDILLTEKSNEYQLVTYINVKLNRLI